MSAFEILLPLALILTLTKLLGLGSQRIGLPAVIGMLIAGLLIGLLKLIPCEPLKNMFFSKEIEGWLKVFSKIGVVLIMFSTGLSTDLKQLKSSGDAIVPEIRESISIRTRHKYAVMLPAAHLFCLSVSLMGYSSFHFTFTFSNFRCRGSDKGYTETQICK